MCIEEQPGSQPVIQPESGIDTPFHAQEYESSTHPEGTIPGQENMGALGDSTTERNAIDKIAFLQAALAQARGERDKACEQLADMKGRLTEAEKDGVTKLPNRQWFETHVPEKMIAAIREPEIQQRTEDTTVQKVPVFALFDIDKFKRINDTYGHDIGDDVLRAFATALQNDLRSGDDLWRHGGDEFGAVLYLPPHTKNKLPKILSEIHERMTAQISNEVAKIRNKDGEQIIFPGVSFAFGEFDGEESVTDLIISVDEKLYIIKEARDHKPDGTVESLKRIGTSALGLALGKISQMFN